MSRDLPVGNGRLTINFDSSYHLRDIYFPHVGRYNQTKGDISRLGVWVDGAFSWVHSPPWRRHLDYEVDTLMTRVVLKNEEMGLEILCQDIVDFLEDIFLRRLVVTDLSGRPREVRLFFTQDFHLGESEVGDAAYYHPDWQALVHYKGDHYFLVGGWKEGKWVIDQFATGIKEVGWREGTWRDAEDGILSGNPVGQGSVDSVVAVHLNLPLGGRGEVFYCLTAAHDLSNGCRLREIILKETPAALMERSAQFWRAWATKETLDLGDLEPKLATFFRRSLLIIRTNIDWGGGIIAGADQDSVKYGRDTYAYVWHRDGALVAYALDRAGYPFLSQKFLEFSSGVVTPEGYFWHKYDPAGNLGSSWHPWFREGQKQLPIQEDETALVLWVLWEHFQKFRSIEQARELYPRLINPAAEFLLRYRDRKTGLPLPSYDLWEERWGVHAFTAAAVYAGLLAASHFARLFGEEDRTLRYRSAAEQVRKAVGKWLWNRERGHFARSLYQKDDQTVQDMTMDSSLCGLFRFGMYEATHPGIVSTMRKLEELLRVGTPVGGIARYEGDRYYAVAQMPDKVPGNPWFISTLWLAQWHIRRAHNLEELEKALELLRWTVGRSLPSGVLAEQLDPYQGKPLSVSPLTWSHAEAVVTILDFVEKKAQLTLCPACHQPLSRHRSAPQRGT